jgi:hypothetical protein
MRQFKQYVDLLDGADLKGSNDKINQTQRNEIKAYGLNAIERDLVENGLTVHRTKDGLVVEIQNKEFGVIYSVIDFKIKNLDYDVDGAVAEYNEAIAERDRKALEKAAKVKKVKGE